jgi:hypothetical protein
VPEEALRLLERTYAAALEALPREGAPAILPKKGHAIVDPVESRHWLEGKLAAVKPSAPPVSFKMGGGFEGRLSLPRGAGQRGGSGTEGDASRGTPVLEIVHESDPRHVLLEQPVASGEQAYKALAGLRDTLRTDRAAIETELARGQQEVADARLRPSSAEPASAGPQKRLTASGVSESGTPLVARPDVLSENSRRSLESEDKFLNTASEGNEVRREVLAPLPDRDVGYLIGEPGESHFTLILSKRKHSLKNILPGYPTRREDLI